MIILFSTYLRIFTLNYQFKISGIITLSLAKKIYNDIIERPYSWHLSNNTSKTITILSNDLDKVREQIIWGLSILVNIILIFAISTYIIYSSPVAIIFLFIVSIFFPYFFFSSKKSFKNKGKILTLNFESSIELFSKVLNNIKDIIIGNYFKFFLSKFENRYQKYINSSLKIVSNYQIPRLLIEGGLVIIMIISFLILFNLYEYNFVKDIPIFTAIIFATLRILQPYQQLFIAFSVISSYSESWDKIKPLLKKQSKKIRKIKNTVSTMSNINL